MSDAQDASEIRQTLSVLHPPASVVEIRVLGVPGRGRPYNIAGYFSDHDAAARVAAEIDLRRKPKGIYLVMNEVRPELLARSPDRMTDYPDSTTSDADITSRNWLLVDIDPIRSTGVPSSEVELIAARKVAEQAKRWLIDQFEFSEPVEAISGNGYHLLFPISLENCDESTQLIKGVLNAASERFGGDNTPTGLPHVTVDTSVFNAGRITKLYGTMARKGHSIDGRPQRRSRLVCIPDYVKRRWDGDVDVS